MRDGINLFSISSDDAVSDSKTNAIAGSYPVETDMRLILRHYSRTPSLGEKPNPNSGEKRNLDMDWMPPCEAWDPRSQVVNRKMLCSE